MAINVPIDVNVSGLSTLEALDERLDDVAEPRRTELDFDTSSVLAGATAVDAALDAAAENRTSVLGIDIRGEEGLPALESTLDAVTRDREIEVSVDTDAARRAATQGGSAISEAFSGAFQLVAKNAIILGVVVTAAFAALPVIGAVAATGLALAFGGGIAAIGIMAALESQKVRDAFVKLNEDVHNVLRRIAEPLRPVLIGITDDIRGTFAVFAPALEKAFADMAPALDRFSGNFFTAFENLKPAIQPLTDVFNTLLDSIGPKLGGFFTNLSDSIIHLSDVISADPELFSGLFVGLLNTLPFVIDVISTLAEAFEVIVDVTRSQLKPAWDEMTAALEPLTGALDGSVSGMDIFKGAVLVVATNLRTVINVITFTIKQTQLVARAFFSVGRSIAQTWTNTRIVTAAALGAIRGVVSRAVAAVRGVVTSGMNSVRAVVSSVTSRVRGIIGAGWSAIQGIVSGAVSRVRGIVSGLGSIVGTVVGIWGRVRGAFSRGISSAVALVRGLPGRVLGAMGNLGSTLYSAGVSLIGGFARGIRAAIGDAVAAASSAVSAVRDFFPFSPAKKGPFSGTGYTTYSGKALTEDFAKAISKTAAKEAPKLDPFADAFRVPAPGARTVAHSAVSRRSTTATGGGGGVDMAALASLFSRLRIEVNLGLDRRTTATFWLEGQRLARTLQ